MFWLGLTVIVAGLYAGTNRYGASLRTTVADGLEDVGPEAPR